MSFSGTFTPLGLNVISALSSGSGLTINATAKAEQGEWTPTGYTQGTVTSSTVLSKLTTKITAVYAAIQAATTDVTTSTYRRMLLIGNGTIPALGNSRPSTFEPSYPGYGSWTGVTTLNSDNYPPKGYPTVGTYSYIKQAYGSYGWITGWPGRSSWQKTTDTYSAATIDTSEYDEYFSDGFIGTVARQAYYELWSGQFNQYNNITNSFTQESTFKTQQNTSIASFVNTKTFMTGTYSNMDDLTSSDIAGVNQAFKIWGNDLINTGRTIYLPDISKFGLPSAFLRNLQRNNVVTDALKAALHLYSDLSVSTLNNIFSSGYTPTTEQERKIYNAFTLIQGKDLVPITYGLNCKTTGLTSLADLINPLKLFPNSYGSLTIPRYSVETASSKIYDFIYVNGGTNSRIQNWGTYLKDILSLDLQVACGGFAMTMQQIKHIAAMDVQKFSQVVTNLELTGLNLPLINSNAGTPSSISLADAMLADIALGSGNSGSYRQCDFMGAASGYPYTGYYPIVTGLIKQLTTTTLTTIYNNIYNLDLSVSGADASLDTLITQANTEIAAILAGNATLCGQLNYYWNLIGRQLFIEQRAIPLCIPTATDIVTQVNNGDITSFVRNVERYALDNGDGQSAPVLEGISDTTVIGGQSLIAYMRESRNAGRLGLTGGDLQNDVSTYIDTCAASAYVTLTNGTITSVTVTSPSKGYTATNPPVISVYPVGLGAKLTAVLAQDGSISNITIENGGSGYTNAQIEIDPPPQCQPPNPSQQTYADTPASRLVPPELVSPASASPSVTQAIADVTICNCDCWT